VVPKAREKEEAKETQQKKREMKKRRSRNNRGGLHVQRLLVCNIPKRENEVQVPRTRKIFKKTLEQTWGGLSQDLKQTGRNVVGVIKSSTI